MKVTTDFSGQDAIRLADCITFASKNNLVIGEDTYAGINQNSGNVYIFDEDWPACIYQDLDFQGPCFSWSCPNCGAEYDLDTVQEAEAKQESWNKNEFCEACNTPKDGD